MSGSGALPSLTILNLYANPIGDDGMKAFAAAVDSGALPSLTKLYIGNNQIGEQSQQQLRVVCQKRGITGSSFLE